MRNRLIVLSLMLCFALPAPAEISIGVGIQSANISLSVSTYPNLVRVPGYPVYYAPGINSNYFFYDGMYWVFEGDRWYSSFWFNGPWVIVEPEFIPVFLLRVPVQYYQLPPAYFVGWQANSPPRWDEHWGRDWARRRSGWDRWDRQSAPAPAPLPTYQRNYSGERYPAPEQQAVLRDRNYRYQPSDPLVRQQSRSVTENRPQPDRALREKAESPQRKSTESAAPPSSAPAASQAPLSREPAPAERQAPPQQRVKEKPEQPASPMNTPRSEERPGPRGEERPGPRGGPPSQREMRPPQGEPRPPQMAPPREDRPSSGPAESGQRRGQQRQPDRQQEKSDERGPDRGR